MKLLVMRRAVWLLVSVLLCGAWATHEEPTVAEITSADALATDSEALSDNAVDQLPVAGEPRGTERASESLPVTAGRDLKMSMKSYKDVFYYPGRYYKGYHKGKGDFVGKGYYKGKGTSSNLPARMENFTSCWTRVFRCSMRTFFLVFLALTTFFLQGWKGYKGKGWKGYQMTTHYYAKGGSKGYYQTGKLRCSANRFCRSSHTVISLKTFGLFVSLYKRYQNLEG